jgi:hypothetical protein
MSVAEIMAARTVQALFKGIEPSKLFVIITHCDKEKPDEKDIAAKNANFELGLLRENTFLFNKTSQSLVGFI